MGSGGEKLDEENEVALECDNPGVGAAEVVESVDNLLEGLLLTALSSLSGPIFISYCQNVKLGLDLGGMQYLRALTEELTGSNELSVFSKSFSPSRSPLHPNKSPDRFLIIFFPFSIIEMCLLEEELVARDLQCPLKVGVGVERSKGVMEAREN